MRIFGGLASPWESAARFMSDVPLPDVELELFVEFGELEHGVLKGILDSRDNLDDNVI